MANEERLTKTAFLKYSNFYTHAHSLHFYPISFNIIRYYCQNKCKCRIKYRIYSLIADILWDSNSHHTLSPIEQSFDALDAMCELHVHCVAQHPVKMVAQVCMTLLLALFSALPLLLSYIFFMLVCKIACGNTKTRGKKAFELKPIQFNSMRRVEVIENRLRIVVILVRLCRFWSTSCENMYKMIQLLCTEYDDI